MLCEELQRQELREKAKKEKKSKKKKKNKKNEEGKENSCLVRTNVYNFNLFRKCPVMLMILIHPAHYITLHLLSFLPLQCEEEEGGCRECELNMASSCSGQRPTLINATNKQVYISPLSFMCKYR